MKTYAYALQNLSRRAMILLIAGVMLVTAILPVLFTQSAGAAPALSNRQLQSTSARVSQATDLTWSFNTPADVANVKQIEIEFCDQPLTGCSTSATNGGTADPAGVGSTDNIPLLPSSPAATVSGTNVFNNPANTVTRVAGRSGGTLNQLNVVITTAAAGASSNGTLAIPGFTNDSEVNRSYYTRVRMYSDTGTTLVYEGVFAQSTSQTLTVTARVQERLDFCVGATTIVDDATTPGASCTNITGSSVDIGNLEASNINVSPVPTSDGGSNTNGVAMVRTNAVNGVVVDYKSVQDNSSGALKVPGATCATATTTTDQCFNSADTDNNPANGAEALAFIAGTEKFGMVVGAVNCGSTSAYVCDTTNSNLVRDDEYDGTIAGNANTAVISTGGLQGTVADTFAWLSNGNADRIASSSASTVKVVDDEALILKFAATAGITTPTGAYSVQTDFIATTTF